MHSTFSRFGCLYLLFSALLIGASSSTLFAEVTVITVDGRELTGEVDEQTNDQTLWIRQESDHILLTTSVAWSDVATASKDGEELPSDRLPEMLQEQATSEPLGFLVQTVVYQTPGATSPVLPAIVARPPQVRSLEVDAFLANLDRDVEPDGLELVVAALDKHGQPVPVKGNLYVRLWGERIQPHGSLVQYEDLQQWNQPVVPVDFTDGLATYALPFQTVHPEFDVRLHSDALVTARLGVFGQGNFSASVPVQIRMFNPVRDRLQLTRGTRFFPDELSQRVRRQLPWRTHTRPTRTRWSR